MYSIIIYCDAGVQKTLAPEFWVGGFCAEDTIALIPVKRMSFYCI